MNTDRQKILLEKINCMIKDVNSVTLLIDNYKMHNSKNVALATGTTTGLVVGAGLLLSLINPVIAAASLPLLFAYSPVVYLKTKKYLNTVSTNHLKLNLSSNTVNNLQIYYEEKTHRALGVIFFNKTQPVQNSPKNYHENVYNTLQKVSKVVPNDVLKQLQEIGLNTKTPIEFWKYIDLVATELQQIQKQQNSKEKADKVETISSENYIEKIQHIASTLPNLDENISNKTVSIESDETVERIEPSIEHIKKSHISKI